MLKHFGEETKNTLEGQIQDDEDMLSNAQTKLAAATEKKLQLERLLARLQIRMPS